MTSDNFGYTGAEPSHRDLLDWLARVFVDEGWSLKRLHRQILNSATYRQASAPVDAGLAQDPHNALYWRYPLRRLDAEALRDSMLAASGELDETMFGPFVPTVRRADGGVIVKEDQPGAHRRSLYLQQRRTQVLSLLDVFDAPGMVVNCTRRTTSTVALQSLALLNSEFTLARAAALARRVLGEAGPRDDDRLSHAFLLTVSRAPSEDERAVALDFLRQQAVLYPDDAQRERRLWTDLCQMLLSSSAFLYVE